MLGNVDRQTSIKILSRLQKFEIHHVPTMRVSASTRFGRYETHSLIRKGGMEEVCLAQDTHLRRPLAICEKPSEKLKYRTQSVNGVTGK